MYLVLGGLLILGGVLFWRFQQTAEPLYKGRNVSGWLEVIADPKADVLLRDEAEKAFIELGTNALPVLTNRLFTTETRYSRWRLQNGTNWVETFRKKLPEPLPAAFWRRAAAKQITLLGSHAEPVAPLLAQALTDPDRAVRGYCYNLLNRLRTPPEVVVPGLIACLRSPDPAIRVFGAGELGFIGPEAKAGVPALVNALSDEDDSVQLNAVVALGRIGPSAKTAMPRLRELLKDSRPEMQLNSASTLTRLDLMEAERVVPVLAALLKHQDNSIVEAAVRQLSDLGTNASQAVAQVEALLEHPAEPIQQLAEEALSRMTKELQNPPADLLVGISEKYFLAVEGALEWDDFSKLKPVGRMLNLPFQAEASTNGYTLFLRQRGVKGTWRVLVNNQVVGTLVARETELNSYFEISPKVITNGVSRLLIEPPKMVDDIEIADIRLVRGPAAPLFHECALMVKVVEGPGDTSLPCRITVADGNGALAALLPRRGSGTNTNSLAMSVRPGVIYTRDGTAEMNLLPGDYTVYASRGMEYSVATQQVTIAKGQTQSVNLSIRKEVNTKGWVAADTHIHTRTHSGHGDATIDERMLTIAGEGIELAIATDHNHHADYSDAATRTKLKEHFTSVIGNEVTTKVGHFNAFPIASGSTVADFKSDNWTELLRGIRATPGVQVVTLNHPRDLHSGFVPLGATNFNPVTGRHVRITNEVFDAMEVITSGAMQSDVYLLYRDWFALLNRGLRVMSVGSSDTHDVSRFILGQGRTYLAAGDDHVDRIDVNEACRSLKAGKASVSLGLFADMDVAQKFHLGDLATNLTDEFIVTVHADSPSWTWVQKVELYANGVKIRETDYVQPRVRLRRSTGFVLNRPFHDVYLVGIATGPGVTAPFAETPRPYQPNSKTFTPKVLASTNPIWIDGDGDGKYTSPQEYAEQLVKDFGVSPERLLPALAPYDEAIVVQALDICRERGVKLEGVEFQKAAEVASPKVKKAWGLIKENGR